MSYRLHAHKLLCVFILVLLALNFKAKAQCIDFANLAKYKNANKSVKKGSVIFFGDSITEMWKGTDSAFFAINDFIDRGISGQTTSQMLLRFRQDVIDLNPKQAIILCGINDIAENTGPISVEDIENNIKCMAELAQRHNIQVLLCSILPSNYLRWRDTIHPEDKISSINKWLKNYAMQNHFSFIDYYAKMVDDKKGMKKEYTTDGVHCTLAGYKVMEATIIPVIKQATLTH